MLQFVSMSENRKIDFLTEFYQRETLKSYMEKLIITSTEEKKSFSIALVDLDHFKRFNDKFGHMFGDEILKYASSTLRLTFRVVVCDFFRYGGDEFVVILPNSGSRETLHMFLKCYHNLANRPFLFENKFYRIMFSCGIATFPCDGQTPEDLIKKADEAMYYSKRHGRNHIILASKLKFLTLKNVLIKLGVTVLIITVSFALYRLGLYKRLIRPMIGEIGGIRVATKESQKLDKIILTNGTIIEGYVIEETGDNVVFGLSLNKGKGYTVFKKSEIAKIKYGAHKN